MLSNYNTPTRNLRLQTDWRGNGQAEYLVRLCAPNSTGIGKVAYHYRIRSRDIGKILLTSRAKPGKKILVIL